MTPTLARMVAGKRRELALPLRWFSIPNVFRYERPQRGRLREHYQLNVDIVGNVDEEQADLEMLTIASAVLKSFGANDADFTLRVSSRKLLNAACSAAGLSGEDVRTYTRLLDRKAKMSKEEFAEKVQALTKTDPLTLIESESDTDVAKEKQTLFRLIDTLRERGNTNVQFDPEITRGFDYYTGMVFEVFDTHTDNSRALFWRWAVRQTGCTFLVEILSVLWFLAWVMLLFQTFLKLTLYFLKRRIHRLSSSALSCREIPKALSHKRECRNYCREITCTRSFRIQKYLKQVCWRSDKKCRQARYTFLYRSWC